MHVRKVIKIHLSICSVVAIGNIILTCINSDVNQIRYSSELNSDANNANKNNTSNNQSFHGIVLDELNVLSGGRDAKTLKCPHPLIPFQNVIVRNDNLISIANKDDLKIPKILHLSMKSRCLPRDLARTVDRWKEALPNYSIFFHDDDAVERLLKEDWPEFPELHEALRCVLYKGSMKIDVWRVLVLYKYGGVYTDIDNWPLETFDETTIRSDLSAFFLKDGFNRPSQWFMASEPRHPMMHLSMTQIIQNILDIPSLRRPLVVYVTGPHAMKSGYESFVRNGDETLSHRDVFANDIVIRGMQNKTVLKSSEKNVIAFKYGYDEIVPYNSTLNVTRELRIKMDGGVEHWPYVLRDSAKYLPHMTCKSYLESVNSGAMNESQIF